MSDIQSCNSTGKKGCKLAATATDMYYCTLEIVANHCAKQHLCHFYLKELEGMWDFNITLMYFSQFSEACPIP